MLSSDDDIYHEHECPAGESAHHIIRHNRSLGRNYSYNLAIVLLLLLVDLVEYVTTVVTGPQSRLPPQSKLFVNEFITKMGLYRHTVVSLAYPANFIAMCVGPPLATFQLLLAEEETTTTTTTTEDDRLRLV